MSLEYRDPSYNHFPSLHVAFVWLGWFACRRGLHYSVIYAILAVGVSVATMFVKQHYFLDLVYGFCLAWVAWLVAGRLLRSRAGGPRHRSDQP